MLGLLQLSTAAHGSPAPALPLLVAYVGIEEAHASFKGSVFRAEVQKREVEADGMVRAQAFLPQADLMSMGKKTTFL